MNHIDEGTIHGWLDGALSAERAREVEAHVAQCAECAETVAEARGLIAGASRILTALDDVPANVTPKRAPPAAPAKRQRQWRAAPWVTGIAAALMLAVGITTWSRDSGRLTRSEGVRPAMESDTMRGITAAAAQSISDARVAPSASQDGKAGVAKAAPRGVPPQPSEQPANPPQTFAAQREASPTRQMEVAPAAPTAVAAAGRAAGMTVTTDTAVERRQRDFAAAPTDSMRVRTTSERDFSGLRATRTRDTTRLRSASEQLADSTRRRLRGESLRLDAVVVTADEKASANVASDSANVRQAAGCYQLGMPAEERGGVARLSERVAAAAPPSEASRRVAPLRARGDVGEARAPARVRLDTTQNRAGLMVRDERNDAYLGTWQAVGQDSVRVILPSHGTFLVTATDRVNCPLPDR